MSTSDKTKIPRAPVKVKPGEPLHRYLGGVNRHSIVFGFKDARGRNAVVIVEPKGEPKDPHGYCAMVAVDDGKESHSLYVGELTYAKPGTAEIVGSMHPFNGATIAWEAIKDVDTMRAALVTRGKEMADEMVLPPPVPAFMADWNNNGKNS